MNTNVYILPLPSDGNAGATFSGGPVFENTRHFGGRMMRHHSGRLCAGTLLAGLLWLGLVQTSWAVKESKSDGAKSSKKPAEVEVGKVSFRLPRYFAAIIDSEQRAEIQEIQASYHERIAALQQQLDELEAAQLKELEGVLTAAQRKTLAERRSGSNKEEDATESSRSKRSSSASKSSKSTSSSKASRKSSGDD